ncbi:SDR family NAD(P)-dependent oxidoreductase [Gammaproteobacteria bacterium]|nr:SDR family NAD(P)-dependent oxidoreductase [Gammaproteobacteria bacterium]
MNILIVGATSAIANATARRFAKKKPRFCLLARDIEKMGLISKDLIIRGASDVKCLSIDFTNREQQTSKIEEAFSKYQEFDIVLLCYGFLPDQSQCQASVEKTIEAIDCNALSVISFLTTLVPYMEQKKKGTIAVVTSVAGDRGRTNNFVYGSAKAMLSAYLQGLRGKLAQSNISVLEIRPGLVDTPMTSHLTKTRLFSTPEIIGKKIEQGIEKNKTTIYAPGYWRLIMYVVKMIPDRLFMRLKF